MTRRTWIGYAAALWALVFAAFHVVWATGWYVGLEQEPAGTAFARRWFLIYDLVVAGLLVFAVPVALALFQPWGRRVPRWRLGLLPGAGRGSWPCVGSVASSKPSTSRPWEGPTI